MNRVRKPTQNCLSHLAANLTKLFRCRGNGQQHVNLIGEFHPKASARSHTTRLTRPSLAWRRGEKRLGVTSALRIVISEIFLDRFPRDDITWVPSMCVQSSIKFGRLFRREWRIRSVFCSGFPRSFFGFFFVRQLEDFFLVQQIWRPCVRVYDGDIISNGTSV